MKRLALAALPALLVVALVFPATAHAATWPAGNDNPTAESRLASLIIAEHKRSTGTSLYRVPQHNSIDDWRAKDMAERNYFSHTILGTNKKVFDYFGKYGIGYWTGAAEIIAWNTYSDSESADVAFRGWMNSPTHRAVIQTAGYNAFGVGSYKRPDGRKVFVATFSKQVTKRTTRATYLRTGIFATPIALLDSGARVLLFRAKRDSWGRNWYRVYAPSVKKTGWIAGWRLR
jgi:hypothetical protein